MGCHSYRRCDIREFSRTILIEERWENICDGMGQGNSTSVSRIAWYSHYGKMSDACETVWKILKIQKIKTLVFSSLCDTTPTVYVR